MMSEVIFTPCFTEEVLVLNVVTQQHSSPPSVHTVVQSAHSSTAWLFWYVSGQSKQFLVGLML